MTKSYFYTDPLAASWMARHFGMRFSNHSNGVEIMLEDIIRHASTCNVCRIHIHPDSARLLEPEKDDLVDLGSHGFAFVTERSDNNINCALFDISTGVFRDGFWHRRWHPVVRRKGIPFMWPQAEESEAA